VIRLSSEAEAPEAAPEAAVEVDAERQAMLDTLTAALGDGIVGTEIAGGDIWVRVANERWHDAVSACKTKLHMDYFCFLASLDWLDNPTLAGEKVWGEPPAEESTADDAATDDAATDEAGSDDAGSDDAGSDEAATTEPTEVDPAEAGSTPAETGPATGVAGGDTRFQVFARLYSTRDKRGITLKADLDEAAPTIQSISDLYAGADWHEREAWEFYGFDFTGHPGLRHIYLPTEFEGWPGRKDFPLLAREVKPWPGLVDVEPLPGGGEDEETPAQTAAVVEGGDAQ
jgi:NADH-quinone oxidoreductase subunit C